MWARLLQQRRCEAGPNPLLPEWPMLWSGAFCVHETVIDLCCMYCAVTVKVIRCPYWTRATPS